MGFSRRSAEKGVAVGTKTIRMYVSDLDQSEIPAGQAYQLSIRHPDGSTPTAAGAPRKRRQRQNGKPPVTA
jgi:hypothetical protein